MQLGGFFSDNGRKTAVTGKWWEPCGRFRAGNPLRACEVPGQRRLKVEPSVEVQLTLEGREHDIPRLRAAMEAHIRKYMIIGERWLAERRRQRQHPEKPGLVENN
jgi:hypothetical protein